MFKIQKFAETSLSLFQYSSTNDIGNECKMYAGCENIMYTTQYYKF